MVTIFYYVIKVIFKVWAVQVYNKEIKENHKEAIWRVNIEEKETEVIEAWKTIFKININKIIMIKN